MFAVDRRVALRDTTLREGIQIPGSRLSVEHKRQFVERLRRAGVPEIEIGLPNGMDACAELGEFIARLGGIRASSLLPCYGRDWRRQVDLAADHGLDRIDVLAPVSDYLLRDTEHYGLTVEQVRPAIEQVLDYAAGKFPRLGVGLIDSCRTPPERLFELVGGLEEHGVDRLIVYDSVGTMLPSRLQALVRQVLDHCQLAVLVHCHNDHGMATANSLAAVEAGASAVDVAVNGIGGRAGNAALEEVAMALENLAGLPTGVDTTQLAGLSALVEQMTGLVNSPLKPIVGRYCFAHVPVMHIRCIAGGNPEAFEPFDPRLVGVERRFDFALAVDYRTALEPLLARSGRQVEAARIPALVEQLRQRSGVAGLTADEVIACIRAFQPEEPDHG